MPTYYHLNTQPWQLPNANYSYRNQPAGATVLLSSCEPPQLTAAAICAWQYDRFVGSWAAANSGMRDAARRFGMNKVILVTIWGIGINVALFISRDFNHGRFFIRPSEHLALSLCRLLPLPLHTLIVLCVWGHCHSSQVDMRSLSFLFAIS